MSAGATGTEHSTPDRDRGLAAVTRAMWACGDYHRFAVRTVWGVGPVLVRACGVSRGDRVLDVAAGTGNVALRAAEAGARVVASDLTPEHFAAGRREARRRGLDVEWVEADAQALPFGDGEFDVVTSAFGAIFAPEHRAVADELARVCRPGGTIGMANFTPEGLAGDFFGLLAPYAPGPPPGRPTPLAWGREDHVRTLFGDRLAGLDARRVEYAEKAESPRAYRDLLVEAFGPVAFVRTRLAPAKRSALDRDLLAFAERAARTTRDGSVEFRYEYLLVVGRTRVR
jgi:ubiquinone/menaquinone biosynthesis C-methylase UbiE